MGESPEHRACRERALDEGRQGRPVVIVDPAQRFGRPHIKGIQTEAIAGMVYAGESPETVCEEYGLTRHELLVALWHEGFHGVYRDRWRDWAENVAYPALAGWEPLDVDTLPLPPDRDELGTGATDGA